MNQALACPASAKYDHKMLRNICVMLILVSLGIGSAMWFRKSNQTPDSQPIADMPFDMPIDDAFRLKIEGSVVVVGVIAAGDIRPDMELEIWTKEGATPVIVKSLEGGPGISISRASAGERVGVLLQGANKDQIPLGSRLRSRPRVGAN
jgi:translation elongation factor EF-Tu-like GTPase